MTLHDTRVDSAVFVKLQFDYGALAAFGPQVPEAC